MTNSTDLDLIMRADTLGLQMDTYAEANIPLGSPFDATYREMEAEWQAITGELFARGWTHRAVFQIAKPPRPSVASPWEPMATCLIGASSRKPRREPIYAPRH